MKKVYLLDAMALIYRAYFALQRSPRVTSYGLNTSAVMGFANTLYDIIKNENPTHIGVAFDSYAPTLRHESFEDYKANREAMPEDIATSIPYIKELISAFNIPILELEGYEADDIIGTLAKEAEKKGFTTYMVTPDKDFGQLVSENIFIYKPGYKGGKPEIMGVPEVCNKFGVKNPLQVIDMLGIMGDKSDNIPGIFGIGEVGAKKLLEQFDSVENLLNNTDKIASKNTREKVINGANDAVMSKQLATIILDVPIDFDEESLKLTEPNIPVLKEFLDKLEMRTFAKRVFTDLSLIASEKTTDDKDKDKVSAQSSNVQLDLFSEANIAEMESLYNNINNTNHEYVLINTEAETDKLVDLLSKSKQFCFDTETTSLDTAEAELVGIAFAIEPYKAYYLNIPPNREYANKIVGKLKPVFENENILKIGQNLKYDIAVLRNYNIKVAGIYFDTMIAHYIIEPESRHNMDSMALSYLNYQTINIESIIGKRGKNQKSMRDVAPEIVKDYACEDADITLRLKNVLSKEIDTDKMKNVFHNIEMPLVEVLENMENNGVRIDIDTLNDYSEVLGKQIDTIQDNIWNHAGTNFNISSPKQLGEVLFDKMKIISNPKRTKTKQYQTGEDVLVKLIDKHPIISEILEYRSLTKLKSTYVDSFPQLINPKTGLIHTSYNQAVTATGRLSSTNPNLQNIPIRSSEGKEIRKAFIPRSSEYTLLSADYSQIELRIIASISNDSNMISAFNSKQDIHAATAARIYKTNIEYVTNDMRRNAKSVNFGIIYGMSAFGLAEQLSISRKEAAEIIDNYFLSFPKIKEYINNIIDFAKKNEYVETLLGRRRYIRDINSANAVVRGYAERNAINAPIQGTAADMIKIAMVDIYNELKKQNLKTLMTMQVHDELVFDVFIPELDTVKSIVKDKMESALKLNVPVVIDMNTGDNWLEAH